MSGTPTKQVELYVVQIRDTKRECWRTVIDETGIDVRSTITGARELREECERKYKRIVRILGEVVE